MSFDLGQCRGALDEGESLGEILEAIGPLDPGRLIQQCPIRRLPVILLGDLAA